MMPVQYEVHERIATVTLNRPEAMNFSTRSCWSN